MKNTIKITVMALLSVSVIFASCFMLDTGGSKKRSAVRAVNQTVASEKCQSSDDCARV